MAIGRRLSMTDISKSGSGGIEIYGGFGQKCLSADSLDTFAAFQEIQQKHANRSPTPIHGNEF